MFDFPASPAIGDASNGYVFNGTGWAGGPIAGQPTEQFVNLAGVTQVDVTVPTWARGAVLDGSVFAGTAANYAGLQVSIDGTTFYAGTSYQLVGGPFHNQTGGYSNQAAGGAPIIYLSYPKSNLLIPHVFQCQLSLESNNTTQLIAARTEAQGYDNTALGFQMWWQGYLNVNLTPPARVQKLRIISGSGAFANGYVKIKWLGATPPQSNAVGEAPQDGSEYVRVNGLWRLKSQTLVLDGVQTATVTIPAGAKMLRAEGIVSTVTQLAACITYWRGSVDGTTFLSGASDYFYVGMAHYSGSAGYTNMPGGAANLGYLTIGTDYSANQPHKFRALFPLTRNANNVNIIVMVNAQYYNSPATNSYTDLQFHSILVSTNIGTSLTPLKALLFGIGNGPVGSAGAANITLDWMY